MLRRKKRGAVVCGSKRSVVRREQKHRLPAVHVATFALERYEFRYGPVLSFERSVIPAMHQEALLFETFHRPLLAALLTAVAGLRSERSGELVDLILVGLRCKHNDPRFQRTQWSVKFWSSSDGKLGGKHFAGTLKAMSIEQLSQSSGRSGFPLTPQR